LELRAGNGLQTVVPPGIHELGDEIVWHTFSADPAVVPAADLARVAGETAALALLMRYWPAKGGRNDAHLGLIGGLLRCGWAEDRVREVVAAVAKITDDEQAHVRVAAVADSAARLKSGQTPEKKVRGFPFLTAALGKDGEEVTRRAREWLGVPPDPKVTFTTGGAPAPGKPMASKYVASYVPFPVDVLPEPLSTYVRHAAAVPADARYVAPPRPGRLRRVHRPVPGLALERRPAAILVRAGRHLGGRRRLLRDVQVAGLRHGHRRRPGDRVRVERGVRGGRGRVQGRRGGG
jgi:hypothetical protein